MTKGFIDTSRQVLRIGGTDRVKFLQDLVTNKVAQAAEPIVYAALLTPQGKYLFDFFLILRDDHILVDVAASRAAALAQRLTMYRLRADVQIEMTGTPVWRGIETPPDVAMDDPRHSSMGWRAYEGVTVAPLAIDHFEALRVEHLIPEPELIENETYILEAGFERLNGVDFRKGCYVGQEITARMKHKTELKKGLAKVAIEGETLEFGDVITVGGKPAGVIYSVSGNQGIAYLRYDRAKGEMSAGSATLTRV